MPTTVTARLLRAPEADSVLPSIPRGGRVTPPRPHAPTRSARRPCCDAGGKAQHWRRSGQRFDEQGHCRYQQGHAAGAQARLAVGHHGRPDHRRASGQCGYGGASAQRRAAPVGQLGAGRENATTAGRARATAPRPAFARQSRARWPAPAARRCWPAPGARPPPPAGPAPVSGRRENSLLRPRARSSGRKRWRWLRCPGRHRPCRRPTRRPRPDASARCAWRSRRCAARDWRRWSSSSRVPEPICRLTKRPRPAANAGGISLPGMSCQGLPVARLSIKPWRRQWLPMSCACRA